MSAFFSGTDWENLEDRGVSCNYFLMLIVNFDGKYCAKVAFKAKKEGGRGVTLNFANNEDGFKPLVMDGEKDDDVLVVMDCKIEIESECVVDKNFEDRYNKVVETKKEEAKKAYSYQPHIPYSGGQGFRGGKNGVPGTWRNGNFYPDSWDESSYMDSERPENVYGGLDGEDWEQVDGFWRKKGKKIGEMTEKEWREHESGDIKFDLRHAKGFLNSIFKGTYMPDDYSDSIKLIQYQEKKLKKTKDREEWIVEFETMIQEHFDVLFIGATVGKYVELLETVVEYLQPYKYIPLVKDMLKAVEDEIQLVDLQETKIV